jgi:serine/threonine protein kinase
MQISEKYSLTEELGIIHSKQFGRTFLGASKKTGEKVFIKFVSKTEHPNGVGRLKNELLFDFNYPGLPKILDFFESEKEMILVRQYVEGVRLDDYWKKLKRIERTPFLNYHLLARYIVILSHPIFLFMDRQIRSK